MTDENSSPPALAISGEFTIFTAADLKPRLLHAVIDAESEDVDIDLSEVSEIDSAGLQLMLLASRQPGKTMHWRHHPDEVRYLITLANVGHLLDAPAAAGPHRGNAED